MSLELCVNFFFATEGKGVPVFGERLFIFIVLISQLPTQITSTHIACLKLPLFSLSIFTLYISIFILRRTQPPTYTINTIVCQLTSSFELFLLPKIMAKASTRHRKVREKATLNYYKVFSSRALLACCEEK